SRPQAVISFLCRVRAWFFGLGASSVLGPKDNGRRQGRLVLHKNEKRCRRSRAHRASVGCTELRDRVRGDEKLPNACSFPSVRCHSEHSCNSEHDLIRSTTQPRSCRTALSASGRWLPPLQRQSTECRPLVHRAFLSAPPFCRRVASALSDSR